MRYLLKGKSEELMALAISLSLYPSDLRSLKIEQQQIHTLLKCTLIVRKIYVLYFRTFLVLVYFQTYELSVTSLPLLTFSIERR